MARRARRLGDFEGAWRLTREIRHADGSTARLQGSAVWRPRGAALLLVETGELSLPGAAPVRAERRYLWRPGLEVDFEDGRFFHRVPPLGGPVSHWCAPDSYQGRYDFAPWPAFRVTWRVTGPRKDYVMESLYTPVGGA